MRCGTWLKNYCQGRGISTPALAGPNFGPDKTGMVRNRSNIGHNHETVILIPIAIKFVVMFQFQIAFFEPHFFWHEYTIVGLVCDGENYPAFPNQMSAASEFLPAEPDPKYNSGVFVVLGHRKLASLARVARRGQVCLGDQIALIG